MILKTVLFASAAFCAALLALKETGAVSADLWKVDTVTEFYITVVMELLTLCAIPVALRLFKWKGVAQSLCQHKEKALLRWGALRMAMLCVPMVLNTVCYIVFGKVAFFYLAVILFICLFFVYPSMGRCEAEVTPPDNNENLK